MKTFPPRSGKSPRERWAPSRKRRLRKRKNYAVTRHFGFRVLHAPDYASGFVCRKKRHCEQETGGQRKIVGFCEDNRIRRRAVLTLCLQARGSSLRIKANAEGTSIFGQRPSGGDRRFGGGGRNSDLSREAEAGGVVVTCTNPFSGVSWQIAIDYDRRTVDSNPARIQRHGNFVARREGWLELHAGSQIGQADRNSGLSDRRKFPLRSLQPSELTLRLEVEATT